MGRRRLDPTVVDGSELVVDGVLGRPLSVVRIFFF
jgi:hypothetical protein